VLVPAPRVFYDTMRSIDSFDTAIKTELDNGGAEMAVQRPEKRKKLGAQLRSILSGFYGIATSKKGLLALAFLIATVALFVSGAGSSVAVANLLNKITPGRIQGYNWTEIVQSVKEYEYHETFAKFYVTIKGSVMSIGSSILPRARKTATSIRGSGASWMRSMMPNHTTPGMLANRFKGYRAYDMVSKGFSSSTSMVIGYMQQFVEKIKVIFTGAVTGVSSSSAALWMASLFGSASPEVRGQPMSYFPRQSFATRSFSR